MKPRSKQQTDELPKPKIFDIIVSMKSKLTNLFNEALPAIPLVVAAVALTTLIFWMEADQSKRLAARSQQTQRVVYVYVENPSDQANDQLASYHSKANTPAKRNLKRATFNRFRRAFHYR